MTGGQLDVVLPRWHFRERHRVAVDAPPAVVLRAVRETTWAEAPLARALMALTGADVRSDGRIVTDFLGGSDRVVHDGPDEIVVVGLIPVGRAPAPRPATPMPELFATLDEPGFVKTAMNVRYCDGVLSTETRILATDAASRRRFGAYWLLIRAGSGVTRRSLLRGIARRVRRHPR